MKQKNLYLMCGIPGSGKSTWLKKNCTSDNDCIISRDKIRFSIVKEDESYFSKEPEVYQEYIKEIQNAIDNLEGPENIYCDATQITERSRDKLLNLLNLTNVKNITCIVLQPSLVETLRRNNKRVGRERVPEKVIRRMYMQFERPEEDINYPKDVIYVEVV